MTASLLPCSTWAPGHLGWLPEAVRTGRVCVSGLPPPHTHLPSGAACKPIPGSIHSPSASCLPTTDGWCGAGMVRDWHSLPAPCWLGYLYPQGFQARTAACCLAAFPNVHNPGPPQQEAAEVSWILQLGQPAARTRMSCLHCRTARNSPGSS